METGEENNLNFLLKVCYYLDRKLAKLALTVFYWVRAISESVVLKNYNKLLDMSYHRYLRVRH